MARRNRPDFGGGGGFGGGGDFSAAPAPAPARPSRTRRPRRPTRSPRPPRPGESDDPFETDIPEAEDGDLSSGSVASDIAFQDLDHRESGAWKFLTDAGVNKASPFGQAQVSWLEDKVEDWAQDYQGDYLLDGSDDNTWENYLYDLAGVGRPAPPLQPGVEPGTFLEPGQTYRARAAAIAPPFEAWVLDSTGKDVGEMKGKRKQELREQYDAFVASLNTGADSIGASMADPTVASPQSAAFRTDIWGPTMMTQLRDEWARQMPMTRGYDSRQYRAPKRVVQF